MADNKLQSAEYARRLIEATTQQGQRTLFWWNECYWRYVSGVYVALTEKKCRTEVLRWLIDAKISGDPDVASDVEQCLRALSSINDDHFELDSWLTDAPLDHVPWVVMRNGRVNPDTGELAVHDPRWFSCVKLPYEYDPDAVCPRWVRFLRELFSGDASAAAQLQEYFGYCLTADTSRHAIMWLKGAAGSGKSLVLKMAQRMLGGNANCSQLALEEFVTPHAIAATRGKLLNISDEVLGISPKVENFMKWYTGGNEITTQAKYVNFFSMRPTARLLIASNGFPQFKDRSGGIWRRLLVLPIASACPVERRDHTLDAKLTAELPGILNWALEGRRRLARQGWTRCESGELFVLSQQEKIQSHESWAKAKLSFVGETSGGGDWPTPDELARDYREWCRSEGVPAAAGVDELLEVAVRGGGRRVRMQKKGVRGYVIAGIRLKHSDSTGETCESDECGKPTREK